MYFLHLYKNKLVVCLLEFNQLPQKQLVCQYVINSIDKTPDQYNQNLLIQILSVTVIVIPQSYPIVLQQLQP